RGPGRRRAPDRHRHRALEDAPARPQPAPRAGHGTDARSDAGRHHRPRHGRDHRRHVHEDRPMTGPLTLTPGHAPAGATRLTVAGEIDMSDIGTLAPAIETTQGPLIVDLTAVDHLDSAGLSVLFRHADRVE